MPKPHEDLYAGFVICAACGAAAPEIARFCPSCGRLLRARADERRVVTVLFADIVGFTGLAESRDPEQVKNILDRCFASLAADVTAYGGRVDKIMGDAIIAFFGAPTAHEDDAERAVRAALQMQRSLADETGPLSSSTMTGSDAEGPEVALRVGLNTGEVLVGTVWAGGDATVLGDVVNVASRLQTAAAPGQVVVGEATWAATSQVIRYRSLGPVQARGRGELVEAWVATGVLAPPGHRPARPVTPLVGRDEEFGILCGALATAARRRRAHLVLLLGEAGIGKSRLAEELALEARQEHGALMLEGRCLPYGEANVWWPFAEALRQACSIEPNDSGETSAAKVRTAVAKATNLDEDHAETQRLADGILHLLGDEDALPDVDRGRAREEAKRAVLSFLEALARQRPLVVVLSELHWADDLVLKGIDLLLERLRALPFVLIATARPELERRWTPAPGRHNSVILTLDPLDEVAAAALLTSLFGSDPPDELRHVLLERGGGNPFFLEELAALIGRGNTGQPASILPEGLPATLRGLVSARLDALGPGDRAVLEDAGVIGRTGPLETLEALGRARGEDDPCGAIDRLVFADLMTVDGDDEWAFRSELVREVAYETLTKAERARRHSTLADLLSQRMRQLDREDEELEQLAHHYGTAAALAGELGSVEGVPTDLGRRALDTVTRAAVRAEERDLHDTAVRLLDQAADLASRWGDAAERRKVLLSRASVRATLYRLDEARADLAEAQASAEADGDLVSLARAMTVRGYTLHKEGHLDTAVATLEQATDLWRQSGDRLGEAEALRIIGMAHLMADDADSAEAPISASLAISQDLHARRGEAWALQNLAWIAFQRGQISLAEERINESLTAFADVRDYGGVGWALGLLGWIRFFQGRRDEAESLAQQVMGELEGSGDHWGRAMMAVLLANVRLWNGRTAEAVIRAKEAEIVFKAHGDVPGQFRALSPLVRGLVALGRISEGMEWLDHALEVAEGLKTGQAPGFGEHLYLNVAVQLGDTARGARQLERLAVRFGGELNADASELGWAEFAGHVALAELQQGNPDEAVRHLERAVRMAQEDPSGYLTSALALAYATAGRPADALAAAKVNDNDAGRTYLDEATASAARGFAFIQLGDRAEGVVAFDSAVARVDTTDDVLAQGLFRMARALGTEDVEELEVARGRLAQLGVAAEGWATAFGIASQAG